MHLVLIGYRGTGKTTVAQHLSLRLGCEWIDLDVGIELAAGKSIAAIFADEGEAAFRDREAQALAKVAGRADPLIVAAGGGVILRDENRETLGGMDHVVWLRAAPETILERVSGDPTTAGRRPNLTTSGGLEEIVQLLRQRTPLYEACADLIVDTDDKSPREIADEIIQRLDLRPSAS